MKTIIAGSRDIDDWEIVYNAIKQCPWKITEVVSGTARGVDSVAAELARKHGMPVKEFPADWDKYGKRAGYIRNKQMAEYADALLAIWDGESKGTKHMIDIARSLAMQVHVCKVVIK